MSTTTTNYNLVKQAGNERPDVSVLNANLDAIDAAMASKGVFATCSTAAATAAKEASYTGFQLVTGATVYICFTYSNTAADATLNVNSTGAKAIYSNGSTSAANVTWAAGETVAFVYDGTYWRMVNQIGLNALRESVSQKWKLLHAGTANLSDGGKLTVDLSNHAYIHICALYGSRRQSCSLPASQANFYVEDTAGAVVGYLQTIKADNSLTWHASVSGATVNVVRVYGID